ncbi:MAG TPA: NADH-quinone oxidoreductase subunit NuoG [Coxiellaceae bacterium]|nr:MAG: hypothetical protein A3E81_00380 [Gammaproteobacteria bacterium RIFCSPHIGHO2_12_FULL_36_30]HLB56617.1 NADH-quinone oxidoreductase subunit NuoG [Coxiellaceae bacterium]
MIEFELDGKKLTAQEGTTIIEAADDAGVYIPRFCYHKKLSIAANCRMCLIEVEKSGKPLPACATPITRDMKIKTKSDMAIKAQRDVMEFLLINHPLDCPICDQGGECELQDLSMGFGRAKSEYNEPKRAVYSQDIGPLIETEMTRCIQCTRCVRFGEEVAGLRELGVVNRGEKEEIGTYVQHFLKSEMSGNIIDICPVGALTNKPARYETRGWEIKEHASISPHDCVGTNVFLHSRGQEFSKERTVFRSVPKENEKINETWMSDRDRFAVEGLYHHDRIYKPQMKKDGKWVEVEWQYALDAIAHLTSHIQKELGAAQIAGITDYSATLEEYYLFQQFIRALGSPHVDHRIRESDFSDQTRRPLFPQLNTDIADIENCDTILLVGSNVRSEQPIISTRIFKATQENLSVMSVNPAEYNFVFPLAEKIIDEDIIKSLSDIVAALSGADLSEARVQQAQRVEQGRFAVTSAIAQRLLSSKKSAIFLGAYAAHHPHAATIRDLCKQIAKLSNATFGLLTDGANSAGAWIAGCIPHRDVVSSTVKTIGKDAKSLLTSDPVAAYFILNTEIENDSAYAEKALENLSKAKLVVCLNTFSTEKMREYADFILPITPYSENEGTFINVNGMWQSFTSVGPAHGESKPAWKILRALANMLELQGFSYTSANQIRDALKAKVDQHECCKECKDVGDIVLPKNKENIFVKMWKIYQDNLLVRRAKSLQETKIC